MEMAGFVLSVDVIIPLNDKSQCWWWEIGEPLRLSSFAAVHRPKLMGFTHP